MAKKQDFSFSETEEKPEGFLGNLSELYAKAEDKWFEILDSIQKMGIPVYSIIDPIEKAGIPSLPVFAGIFLLLLIVIVSSLLTAFGGQVSFSVYATASGADVPLGDVEISLTQNNREIASATTNADGYASFDIPSGNYKLTATSVKCTERVEMDISVNPAVSTINIALDECSGIAGNEVEIYFEPEAVGDVSVKKYQGFDYDSKSSCGENKCVFRTQPGYTYQFESTSGFESEEGRYYTAVELDDISRSGIKIRMYLRDSDDLYDKSRVTILLVDESGAPLTNVVVKIVNPDDLDGTIDSKRTGTGSIAGEALFEEPVGTEFKVVVEPGQNTTFFVSNQSYTFLETDQVINLTVTKGVDTTITVTGKGGTPKFPNVNVVIMDKSLETSTSKITGTSGSFVINLVRDEEYFAVVKQPDYQFTITKVIGGQDTIIETEKMSPSDKGTMRVIPTFSSYPNSLVIGATVTLYFKAKDDVKVKYASQKIEPSDPRIPTFTYVDLGTYEVKVSREQRGAPRTSPVNVEIEDAGEKVVPIDVVPMKHTLRVNVVKDVDVPYIEKTNLAALYEIDYTELGKGSTYPGLGYGDLQVNEQTRFWLKAESTGSISKTIYSLIEPLYSGRNVTVLLADNENSIIESNFKKIHAGRKAILNFTVGTKETNEKWDSIKVEITSSNPKMTFGDFSGGQSAESTPLGYDIKEEYLMQDYNSGSAMALEIPAVLSPGVQSGSKITVTAKATWTKGAIELKDTKTFELEVEDASKAYCVTQSSKLTLCIWLESETGVLALGGAEIPIITQDTDMALGFKLFNENFEGSFDGEVQIKSGNRFNIVTMSSMEVNDTDDQPLDSNYWSIVQNTANIDLSPDGAVSQGIAKGEFIYGKVNGVASSASTSAKLYIYIDGEPVASPYYLFIADGNNEGMLAIEPRSLYDTTGNITMYTVQSEWGAEAESIELAELDKIENGGINGPYECYPDGLSDSAWIEGIGTVQAVQQEGMKLKINFMMAENMYHYLVPGVVNAMMFTPPIKQEDTTEEKTVVKCVNENNERGFDEAVYIDVEIGGSTDIPVEFKKNRGYTAFLKETDERTGKKQSKLFIGYNTDCLDDKEITIEGFGTENFIDASGNELLKQGVDEQTVTLEPTPNLLESFDQTQEAIDVYTPFKFTVKDKYLLFKEEFPARLRLIPPKCLEMPDELLEQTIKIAADATCNIKFVRDAEDENPTVEIPEECNAENPDVIVHLEDKELCSGISIFGHTADSVEGVSYTEITDGLTISNGNIGDDKTAVLLLTMQSTLPNGDARFKDVNINLKFLSPEVGSYLSEQLGESVTIKPTQKYGETLDLDCETNWCTLEQAFTQFEDVINSQAGLVDDTKKFTYNVIVDKKGDLGRAHIEKIAGLVLTESAVGITPLASPPSPSGNLFEFYIHYPGLNTLQTGKITFENAHHEEAGAGTDDSTWIWNYIILKQATKASMDISEDLTLMYPVGELEENREQIINTIVYCSGCSSNAVKDIFKNTWGLTASITNSQPEGDYIVVQGCTDAACIDDVAKITGGNYQAIAYKMIEGGKERLYIKGVPSKLEELVTEIANAVRDQNPGSLIWENSPDLTSAVKKYIALSTNYYTYAYLDNYAMPRKGGVSGVPETQLSELPQFNGKRAVSVLPDSTEAEDVYLRAGALPETDPLPDVTIWVTEGLAQMENYINGEYEDPDDVYLISNEYVRKVMSNAKTQFESSGLSDVPVTGYYIKYEDAAESNKPKYLFIVNPSPSSAFTDKMIKGLINLEKVGIKDNLLDDATLGKFYKTTNGGYGVLYRSTIEELYNEISDHLSLIAPLPGADSSSYNSPQPLSPEEQAAGGTSSSETGAYLKPKIYIADKYDDAVLDENRCRINIDNWYVVKGSVPIAGTTVLSPTGTSEIKAGYMYEIFATFAGSDYTLNIKDLGSPTNIATATLPPELKFCGFREDMLCVPGTGAGLARDDSKWCATGYYCSVTEGAQSGTCVIDDRCGSATNLDRCKNNALLEDKDVCKLDETRLSGTCVECLQTPDCTTGSCDIETNECIIVSGLYEKARVYLPRPILNEDSRRNELWIDSMTTYTDYSLPDDPTVGNKKYYMTTDTYAGLACGEVWRTIEEYIGRDCENEYGMGGDQDNELRLGCRESFSTEADCTDAADQDDNLDTPFRSRTLYCDADKTGATINYIGNCEEDWGYHDAGGMWEYDWCEVTNRIDRKFCINCPIDKPFVCISNELGSAFRAAGIGFVAEKIRNNPGNIFGTTAPAIICSKNPTCVDSSRYQRFVSDSILGSEAGVKGTRKGLYYRNGNRVCYSPTENDNGPSDSDPLC